MPTKKKPTSLLDLMTPEDRKKALRNRRARERDSLYHKVNPEMYVVAEFGYYFGYDGIRAIKNNEISLEEVHILLAAARKVWYSKVVDQSHGGLVAGIAAGSKNPSSSFNKNMQVFIKKMKVNIDER